MLVVAKSIIERNTSPVVTVDGGEGIGKQSGSAGMTHRFATAKMHVGTIEAKATGGGTDYNKRANAGRLQGLVRLAQANL
jgi:hypothetical protein